MSNALDRSSQRAIRALVGLGSHARLAPKSIVAEAAAAYCRAQHSPKVGHLFTASGGRVHRESRLLLPLEAGVPLPARRIQGHARLDGARHCEQKLLLPRRSHRVSF